MRERGNAYVIALLTLSVLGTLAGVLGWSTLMQARQVSKQETRQALESLIRSGITYASWKVRYRRAALPFNETLTLPSGGSIAIRTTAAPAFGENTMQVQVTAQYRGETLTRQRILNGARVARRPTEFALFLDEPLRLNNGILQIIGDVHTNGFLIAQSGAHLNVDGAVTTAGTLGGNVNATLYKESGSSIIPDCLPDLDRLRLIATHLHIGNLSLPLGYTFSQNEIFYVKGNLLIQGTLRGSGIIVAEGNLEFQGDTQYADKSSLYIFIANGNITIPAGAQIAGVLISLDGNIQLGAGSMIKPGAVVVLNGNFDPGGNIRIEHDPRVNTDFFRQLSRLEEIEDPAIFGRGMPRWWW